MFRFVYLFSQWQGSRHAGRAGTLRVSQVPGISLPTCHALSWTPADPRRPHHCGLSVLASGPLTPSPSAFKRFTPPTQFTGLYQASGSTVSLVAHVVPCVRFNCLVRFFNPP